MHVLLASHRYAPVPGGTERVVQSIAEGLVAAGHRATVITQLEPGMPAEETLHGVEVRRIRVRRWAGIRFPVRYVPTLRSIGADLFHLHGNRIWCADFYFPKAASFPWPQVLTGHGFYQYEMHPRWRDRYYFERYFPRVLRRFDAYTPDTEREAAQLRSWGVPPERLRVVPLGVSLEEFRSPPPGVEAVRARFGITRPRLAVYAGGFFENKRVDRLVRGIAPVRDRWSLLAIGRDLSDSPYNATVCAQLAALLGVELRTPGVLAREETVAALFASDAVVLGSQYEGFGLLPVEAMSAGRPFVGFDAGAVSMLAATGAGFCVRSPEEFARALQALEEDGERERRGGIGRCAAPEYSEAAMVRRYLAVYDEIARTRAAAPEAALRRGRTR
ncbi:MAG: glycosyltransferase family 4 protein [Thermoplasmata archaeon]|nr:glycosyltransferase family 4 protein [Thermoplasmata archaeon]